MTRPARVLAASLALLLVVGVAGTATAGAGRRSEPPAITRLAAITGYHEVWGDPDSRGLAPQAWVTGFSRSVQGRVRFTVTYDAPAGTVVEGPVDVGIFSDGTARISIPWSSPVPAGATSVTVTAQPLTLVTRTKAYVPAGSAVSATGLIPQPWDVDVRVLDTAS